MTDESIPTIARGLSEAQRRMLNQIRPQFGANNGKFGWPTLSVLRARGLCEGRPHASSYREYLTPLGAQVKAHLQQVPATPTLSTGDEMCL